MSAASSAWSSPRAILVLLFGVAVGPTGWILQIVLDYGLASHGCFPSDRPAPQVAPDSGKLTLGLIALACLALALSGAWTSWLSWRRARGDPAGARACFLALCGLFASVGFAAAIVASAVSLVIVPSCWTPLT